MKILAVSGKKGQGKTLTSSLLHLHLNGKRCLNLSYYYCLEYIIPGIREEEIEASIKTIKETSPNFFVEAVKIKIALCGGIFDYVIIDDLNTEADMQKIKVELGAVIIGVVKDFPYSVPYTVRNELSTEILGRPDILIKNGMTMNKLQSSIIDAVAEMTEKGMI